MLARNLLNPKKSKNNNNNNNNPNSLTLSKEAQNMIPAFDQSSFPSKPNEYDFLFKLLLIGATGVGKSSLLTRFVDNEFNPSYVSTIGVDFKIKTITLDDKKIKLQIWDTAGQERFKTVTNAYFRGSHGIAMVYDITSESSFESIRHWLEEIQKYAPRNAIKLLIGNKLDLESSRFISTETATTFAQENFMLFIETSAKDNISVSQAFIALAAEIRGRIS